MIGVVVRAAAIGEERLVVEQLEAGVRLGAVFDILDAATMGVSGVLLVVELCQAGELLFFPGGCSLPARGVGARRLRRRDRAAEDFAAGDGERGAAVVDVAGVVEEGEQLVVLAVLDGVEFVRVALAAADGEAEPDRAGGVDAIDDGFVAELLLVGAAFFVDERVAVEGGGDALALGGARAASRRRAARS